MDLSSPERCKVAAFRWFIFLLAILAAPKLEGQVVNMSEPEKDDTKNLPFEIIGKTEGKVYIYKYINDRHYICVYGPEMKLDNKEKLSSVPPQVTNVEFMMGPAGCFLFYEHQRKDTVRFMVLKLGTDAKPIGLPIELDSTMLGETAQHKVYTFVPSEDKRKALLVKIERRGIGVDLVSTCSVDMENFIVKKHRQYISIEDGKGTLSEFHLANNGDIVCIGSVGQAQTDGVSKISLFTQKSSEDSLNEKPIDLKGIYLDDIKVRVDNKNSVFLVSSFFTKQKRGDVDGVFLFGWDEKNDRKNINTHFLFSDTFRMDVKDGGKKKAAFNDFYLRQVMVRRDGGVMLIAESAYNTTRTNNGLNRWDTYGAYPSIGYGGFGSGMYPGQFGRPQVIRYYTDNIIFLSVSPDGKLEWANVVRKNQQYDETDNFLSFGTMNSGDRLHFLFNLQEKRETMLTEQTLTADGQLKRSPAFKGFDDRYQFMPRLGKQTGLKQYVMPCIAKGYICFAKIDF